MKYKSRSEETAKMRAVLLTIFLIAFAFCLGYRISRAENAGLVKDAGCYSPDGKTVIRVSKN